MMKLDRNLRWPQPSTEQGFEDLVLESLDVELAKATVSKTRSFKRFHGR
jgi:hypothetical protein